MMKVPALVILTLGYLAVATSAFQAAPPIRSTFLHAAPSGRAKSCSSHSHHPPTLLQAANGDGGGSNTKPKVATDVTITKAVKVPTSVPATTIYRTIDDGVYKFNKAVIDTVYDIICFLYPVKGTERDFARFFVLETVARVPYFAYLSVMHLRGACEQTNCGD